MDTAYYGMISEDKSAVANLPQQVVQKTYPKCDYMSYELDDTIKELDTVRNEDIRNLRSHISDTKY